MFRLMLDAHTHISNPGEVDFLFDHIFRDSSAPCGWQYDRAALKEDRIFRQKGIDLPEGLDGIALLEFLLVSLADRGTSVCTLNVHRHAGRIIDLLPTARFIHLARDPRDVAHSAIGMGWVGNSYYGARYWLQAEMDWERADIPEKQCLEVRFEQLMLDITHELRRVCAFLGVPFSDHMLDYHKNSTYAPPDPKMVQSWRRKASPREVALIEGRVGTLMEKRGYERAGPPIFPRSAEKLTLAFQNRLARWRFRISRYGFWLFAASHASRFLGLKALRSRLKRLEDEIKTRNLK